MNRLSITIGFWSATFQTVLLVAYTIFIGLLIFSKPSAWTDLSNYLDALNGSWHSFLTWCQLAAFLSAPIYLLLVNCIHDYTDNAKKILTRISICFAAIFTTLSSINYFVQISAVRQSIIKGQLEGLEQFIQLNTSSPMYALVMLGWTLFLGLSSLFLVPVFSGGRLERVLKVSFLANGSFCIIGCLGYVADIMLLNILYVGGMGTSMIVVSVSLAVLFRRIGNTAAGKSR